MAVNNKSDIGGQPLTDEIATAAGLPRGTTASETIRKVSDDVQARDKFGTTSTNTTGAKSGTGSASDKASDAIDSVKDRAAGLAGDVKQRLGETVGDLRDKASSTYSDTREWASDMRDTHSRRINDFADRGTAHVRRGRSAVEDFVSENPLLVGVVGVAAGLLLGALLPRTRKEDETVGHWSDEVKDTGLRYAREFTERGREFVETALDPENLNAATQRATGQPAETKSAGASPPRGPTSTSHH
jgi:ElaB/YqjD/DUF883 family membrane-anchored ribosome-binding protein